MPIYLVQSGGLYLLIHEQIIITILLYSLGDDTQLATIKKTAQLT